MFVVLWEKILQKTHRLVGALEHQLYSPINIGNVLIPIDFPIFQRGLFHHQPVGIVASEWAARVVNSTAVKSGPWFGRKKPGLVVTNIAMV